MKSYSNAELEAIKRELNSIISELESISIGLKNDFKGIGNERCAASIDRVLSHYYTVRQKLNNLDTTPVVVKDFNRISMGGETSIWNTY